jgi:hypothetical protein
MVSSSGIQGGRRLLPLIFVLLIAGLVFEGLPMLLGRPERSLVDPGLEGEAVAKALSLLKQDQRIVLMKREKDRIKAEPLDRSALNNLSLLESLADNTGAAEAYALESSTRTLRDVQSQISALRLYLIKKNYAKAMFHLDGILVSEPELGPKLYPSVASLLGDEEAAVHLAKTLNRNPPWRSGFFAWLNANGADDQASFKIFNLLRKQGGAVSNSEVLGYLQKLVTSKNYERAYFVWLDSLDQAALRKVGNVFDGGFDGEAKNQYFDWTFYAFANGEISIVPKRDDPKERVLRLSFYNSTEMFGHVFQYLRLKPGAYRFAGEETANDLEAVGGLRFVVSCADTGAVLSGSSVFLDTTPWQPFSFNLNVPTEGCTTQILRLQSASSAVLDAKLDGEILFDNITITSAETNSLEQGMQ